MDKLDRQVLEQHARAIVHMRERHATKALGLVLGAGVSKPVGFPAWEELVQKIANSDKVKGAHLLAATDGVSATAKTQMLLHHYRTKRLDEMSCQPNAKTLRKVHGEWRRIVQEALYDGVPKTAELLKEKHPYLKDLIPIIASSPMTVTYNFDDMVERLVQHEVGSTYGRPFETIWDVALQPKRDTAVIYHPNGYLPSNILEHPSENLVFSEDEFADQLIESMAGHHASLLHHISRSTCLFVGLSLVDETLRHLLRQSARVNPGNFHYYIQWREAGAARNHDSERAIREANFEVYNLITLFLDDSEIAALGRLITIRDGDLVHVAEEEGIDLRYVYYLTGAIGAGKTTTLSYLASLETYEEWTEPRHSLLAKSWTDLTPDQREEVDRWILSQFAKKNLALLDRKHGVIVVDRPPLDPLSFALPSDIAAKAQAMIEGISPGKSNRRVVDGQVVMLSGEPRELEARVISRHKESGADVIEELQESLRKIYGVKEEIDTSGSSIHDVVKSVAKKIHLQAYCPDDLNKRLHDLADGGAL
ncbi:MULTISPECIES: SIR2 family protein [unclassified Rhizobium]|uniref:SIR2 family protein n=1 Tax=unclassified Rhizobium TaxID=2613769 RepID=UPI0007E93AA1|nr:MULTISPECIES: SIR2 family protein [unclassified Rhizobium]ANM11365.1 SIR2 family protein [Rhizobium sp. N324]OYD04969.1 SIR2 family protein [Rhizobium sp. N4311]